MKTLDEVIKALEWCIDDSHDDCSGCPYDKEEEGCHQRNLDALHYLKTIETTENLYHDAVNELSKWKDEDWKDRCLPLTWDELLQMEGKPVWVEISDVRFWGYILETERAERDVMPRIQILDCRRMNLYKDEIGTIWQAYRKDRE